MRKRCLWSRTRPFFGGFTKWPPVYQSPLTTNIRRSTVRSRLKYPWKRWAWESRTLRMTLAWCSELAAGRVRFTQESTCLPGRVV